MNKKLEELYLYKAHVDLMYYSYSITEKFPKKERFALYSDIKDILYKILENIIMAQKERNIKKRIDYQENIDVEIKVLLVMIRLAYRNKYINSNNYGAWSRKISNVNNLLYGWKKQCQKLLEENMTNI